MGPRATVHSPGAWLWKCLAASHTPPSLHRAHHPRCIAHTSLARRRPEHAQRRQAIIKSKRKRGLSNETRRGGGSQAGNRSSILVVLVCAVMRQHSPPRGPCGITCSKDIGVIIAAVPRRGRGKGEGAAKAEAKQPAQHGGTGTRRAPPSRSSRAAGLHGQMPVVIGVLVTHRMCSVLQNSISSPQQARCAAPAPRRRHAHTANKIAPAKSALTHATPHSHSTQPAQQRFRNRSHGSFDHAAIT